MLEPPFLDQSELRSFLEIQYGRRFGSIQFLPLGADAHTAVFRTEANGQSFLVKLRSGPFHAASVLMPHHLHTQGVPHLIPPVAAESGRLWTDFDRFMVVLYPFVNGQNGNSRALTGDQWKALGQTLARLHRITLPETVPATIARETFDSCWRDSVLQFQERIATETYSDAAAAALAELLASQADVVSDLVKRATRLAAVLERADLPHVLCHGDIQAWNVLISDQGDLFIVDWDTLVLAPKERDLMFIGAGLGWRGESAQTAAHFYEGYGDAEIDPIALAYYRYERIVEDIAAYCDQLLARPAGGPARWEAFRQISSQFEPGDVVELAFSTDRVDSQLYATSGG